MTVRTPLRALLGLALAVGVLGGPSAPAAPAGPAAPAAAGSSWLVSVVPGQLAQAREAAAASGATVVHAYDVLDVLRVHASGAGLASLLADPSVLGARADSAVRVAGDTEGGDRKAPTRNVFREETRADVLAGRGGTGSGVTVAVIDTGITAVPQLADRLVPVVGLDGQPASCVNFTSDATCDDGYGHGTFLAGLLAGGGSSHPGMSKARLLSVKLAGASGATDTSTLLAALQWVVAHRQTYGISVLNLSLGTPSGASWKVDPLNYAVQRAVDAGIVVVVSAGNTGPEPMSVLKPGDDPLVLTVGAADDRGTPGRGDDAVPLFSAQGPTRTDRLAKPDVVAPGARLVSLRSPGSTIEQNVPGGVDASYRRGSGTSMATAVVSGAVAQLLSLHPAWTPAQVKTALMATATPVGGQPATVVGHGLVDVAAAAGWTGTAQPGASGRSSGTGTVEGSRGPVHVVVGDGTEVVGEVTSNGRPFDGAAYRQTGWQSTNWQSTNWQSSTADPSATYGRPGHGSAVLGAWG